MAEQNRFRLVPFGRILPVRLSCPMLPMVESEEQGSGVVENREAALAPTDRGQRLLVVAPLGAVPERGLVEGEYHGGGGIVHEGVGRPPIVSVRPCLG